MRLTLPYSPKELDTCYYDYYETMYFDGRETSKDKIAAYAKELFGDLGGYAQQYLFYYGKTIKMGVK